MHSEPICLGTQLHGEALELGGGNVQTEVEQAFEQARRLGNTHRLQLHDQSVYMRRMSLEGPGQCDADVCLRSGLLLGSLDVQWET
jgi:hypothetical protein